MLFYISTRHMSTIALACVFIPRHEDLRSKHMDVLQTFYFLLGNGLHATVAGEGKGLVQSSSRNTQFYRSMGDLVGEFQGNRPSEFFQVLG